MTGDYQIEFVDQPAWDVIGSGIQTFNREKYGDDRPDYLCFVLKSPGGEFVGGVIGVTYWSWLYIELMWVREDLRGCGYGEKLLLQAEEEGRKRGAAHAYLDTFDFQAPNFYKRLGYQEFGILKDFPPGHSRYFLCKDL